MKGLMAVNFKSHFTLHIKKQDKINLLFIYTRFSQSFRKKEHKSVTEKTECDCE